MRGPMCRRVRRVDVQYTPLPERLQWLNDLSDDEYNAYWDEEDARCASAERRVYRTKPSRTACMPRAKRWSEPLPCKVTR